jgi:formylglycine-generating enzyme required for sulfatase activity
MIFLPAARFLMGSDEFYPDEAPVREEAVGTFWIDETPVTNAQFARFVQATGHVTFAEVPPDPRVYPGIPAHAVHAGSCVFRGGEWQFVAGADWRHPIGPESTLSGLDDHPVVHIVPCDAEAYAAWAGKAIPSEAEWEYAARGGLVSKRYAWGDEFMPGGRIMARTWQGTFPVGHALPPDQQRTAAVRSYPPNGFGLYDMIGNVWEWTSDWYAAQPVGMPQCCSSTKRERSIDPLMPVAVPRRAVKGGSHLCAPNYCQRYRPAARWPQPIDTPTSHIGFRCIVRAA